MLTVKYRGKNWNLLKSFSKRVDAVDYKEHDSLYNNVDKKYIYTIMLSRHALTGRPIYRVLRKYRSRRKK